MLIYYSVIVGYIFNKLIFIIQTYNNRVENNKNYFLAKTKSLLLTLSLSLYGNMQISTTTIPMRNVRSEQC